MKTFFKILSIAFLIFMVWNNIFAKTLGTGEISSLVAILLAMVFHKMQRKY